MKIIDLLNLIAEGKELPKRVIYNNVLYERVRETSDYVNKYYDDYLLGDILRLDRLNDEIEIVKEGD